MSNRVLVCSFGVPMASKDENTPVAVISSDMNWQSQATGSAGLACHETRLRLSDTSSTKSCAKATAAMERQLQTRQANQSEQREKHIKQPAG